MSTDFEQLASALAASLRAERARLNLTIRKAGELAGIHYMSISRYENGKLPTLEALYRLADVYGCDPATLLPPRPVANREGNS